MSRMERSLVVRVWEQNRRQAELNARFISKEERELHRLARERVYDSMLVSIRMPDGVRLEGRFNPHEDVSDLIEFVRAHLAEELDAFELVLATPAKVGLVPGKSLAESQLVPPASLVHLKVHSKVAGKLKDGYLSPASKELLVDDVDTGRVPKGVKLTHTHP
mmetsp:Transcript_61410/g.168629  ORF Transcript_61410/g.168629 Transcript_61410/m.168629 type:complete len:162 (-) Transcript_61410:1136-1621(-)